MRTATGRPGQSRRQHRSPPVTALVALTLVVALATSHWLGERHHRGPARVRVPVRDEHHGDRG